MPLRIRTLLIAAVALLLAGCVTSPGETAADGDIYIKGKLVSVQPAPGCGTILAGSPAIYQVLSGPNWLNGKRINVLVACIEMPLVQGDLRLFTVGAIHYLIITKQNIHKVELPASLPGESWFYLKAASLRDLRPNNSFKPTPLRGAA